ncbi:MAG TPA: hypothetical protein VLB50_08875 [Ignavibacteriaceae bacterium]|nr:hypothetical protein [Ignavibacteriaceae bacterium]
MTTLNQILTSKPTGLYYNNRLILPFQGIFLKIIVNDDIITDFSPSSKHIYISENENYTDIYFKEYKHLKDSVSKYEAIKMVLVEKGKDIFDFDNHKKIAIYLKDKHQVTIEETDEDIIFIE